MRRCSVYSGRFRRSSWAGRTVLILSVIASWLATSWAGGSSQAAPITPPLRVVATILPVFCLATNVGGNRVEVRYLVGAGGDGHDYQLTPRDRSAIESAHVVLMNGLGIEPWLKKTLASMPSSVQVLDLSRGLESWLIPAASGHGHEHGHAGHATDEDEKLHGRGEMNPHTWLDPMLMRQMVTNVCRQFQQLDPAGREVYAQNASNYVARIEQVELELQRGLEPVRGSSIVTFHDAFPYFARRFGLKVVGVIEEIPDVDPTARHLARLSERIRAAQARAIFVEPRHSRRLAERLGRDLRVRVGTLDTMEVGVPSADAYESGLRGILKSLESALK